MSSRSLLAASGGVHFKSPKYVWAAPLYDGQVGDYAAASFANENFPLRTYDQIPVAARFTGLEEIYENLIAPCVDPVSEFYQRHAEELSIFEWRLLPVLANRRFQVRTATMSFSKGDCK